MPNTKEQRHDIIECCAILLDRVLAPFKQTDNTPEGRMITQLKWLMERAKNNDLALPVDDLYTSSLRYIYTDGELMRNASSSDPKVAWSEVGVHMHRLMVVCVEAKLITKLDFYPYAIRCTDALIRLLQNPPRQLSESEKNAISELQQLKSLLTENKIEPPLISYLPDYKNLNELDANVRYSPRECGFDEAQRNLIKTVTNLIFEGVRPDTWLTPEDADRETQQWT